ncbi:chitin disaccharide deacetylase [Oceanobacillus sp. J11TS1]|uniref:chitin disaccharide deacetylase n=1 Tax=Oceanobacillus sp. J11TS1 TaxID=2807191 RepID=UPI001B2AFAC2|nr:chitin disaccharide deacetylase [Oceanobacillus sp. J11TS1]GIO23589.1 carbohydrate deacetylase [Oceanobacillus sp. J11TS1]
MRVEINADDFGLTKGVTDGIIQAHQDGCVTSTTLMMNGLATDYAIEKAKENPALKVGIHLVLTWGSPLHSSVQNLVNTDGTFKFTSSFNDNDLAALEISEIELEWRTQLDAFLATGLSLDHIDSHHHVHGWPPLKNLVIQLAKDYEVPVRYVDSLADHPEICWTDKVWLGFYKKGVTDDLFDVIQNEKVSSIEVMTHPGRVDEDLRTISSYTDPRENEIEILSRIKVPDWAK